VLKTAWAWQKLVLLGADVVAVAERAVAAVLVESGIYGH